MNFIAARVLVLLLIGCHCVLLLATADAAQPNVLFIAIDDLRTDCALGVEYAKTPNLDGFAKTARLFGTTMFKCRRAVHPAAHCCVVAIRQFLRK